MENKNYINSVSGPMFIMTAALLWALDGLIRRNLYSLPPITVIFFEHLFGLLILFPFVARNLLKTRLQTKDWLLVFLISVLSGLLGTVWFTTALFKVSFISFSVVFLLQKTQPLFAIGTAVIFLKEKFDKRYIMWAALAIAAAYFVTFPGGRVNLSTGQGTVIAALFALGAAFAWGSSTTFSKMLLGKVSVSVGTFYRFLFTVIIALPVLLLLGHGATLKAPTLNQFGLFVLIAVSTGMIALLIYYKGLSKTPVHVTTILELLFPFFAIVIDMIVFKNFLNASQWLAAIILIFSIYKIVELRRKIA